MISWVINKIDKRWVQMNKIGLGTYQSHKIFISNLWLESC